MTYLKLSMVLAVTCVGMAVFSQTKTTYRDSMGRIQILGALPI